MWGAGVGWGGEWIHRPRALAHLRHRDPCVGVLLGTNRSGQPPAIIPDAAISASLPAVPPPPACVGSVRGGCGSSEACCPLGAHAPGPAFREAPSFGGRRLCRFELRGPKATPVLCAALGLDEVVLATQPKSPPLAGCDGCVSGRRNVSALLHAFLGETHARAQKALDDIDRRGTRSRERAHQLASEVADGVQEGAFVGWRVELPGGGLWWDHLWLDGPLLCILCAVLAPCAAGGGRRRLPRAPQPEEARVVPRGARV